MKGSIFKRKWRGGKVSWCLSLDVPAGEDGKRERIFKSGFSRQADAQRELTRLLQEANDGLLIKPSPQTFGDFMEEWFREYAVHQCSGKTVERYRQLADYVLPKLGATPLHELTSLVLERLYNSLRTAGGRRGELKANGQREPSPLSAKTVRHIAGLIQVALNSAVRWKLIKVNPAIACQLPKMEIKEAVALDQQQTEWFLDASRGHWMYPILMLAVATGCRRGELLALTWPDVDLQSGVLLVSKSLEQTRDGLRIKTTKNRKARRFLMPAVAIEALQVHRQEQEKRREAFAQDYRADLNLVFSNPEGDYLKPDSITSKACLLAKKAGLKGIGLHSLRHSHASQLLSAGVQLPTVSKRLGHSSVHVTAQIYSHALPSDEVTAAEAWDKSMRSAVEGAKVKQ